MAHGKVTITYQAHPDEPERNMVYAMLTARILKAAKEAKKGGYDYFTTTLSISP